MEEWPDFLIYAVKYTNKERTRIEHVQVLDTTQLLMQAVGDKDADAKRIYSRNQVITFILNGKIFKTYYRLDSGEWQIGQRVYIIEIDSERFLRIDFNQIKTDKLQYLPEFE